MENCFETLVGIVNVETCNCEPNLPTGNDTVRKWYYEVFVASASPGGSATFEADYKFPTDENKIQVYENGVEIAQSRFSVSGKEITITSPLANAYYQVWYYAYVSAADTIPAFDTSKSGLFLSDILPISELQSVPNKWQTVLQARTQAIKESVASLSVAIKRNAVEQHVKYQGFVGGEQNDGYLDTTFGYAGVRIRTNPIQSGYLRINRIATYFEKSGTVNAWLFDGAGTVVSRRIELRTGGGGRKMITDVNIEVPLLNDFNTCQDYYLLYEYDPTNRPKKNKTYCAPCNKSSVNPITYVNRYGLQGVWPDDYRGALAWNNYIIAGGVEWDDLSDFTDTPDNVSTYMNGLALEIEVGCDLTKGFCRMLNSGGPEVMALATAIQRRWATILVDQKVVTSVPSRSNVAKGDAQKSMAGVWEGEFAEAMNYLAGAVDENSNDCVVCRPRISMGKLMT